MSMVRGFGWITAAAVLFAFAGCGGGNDGFKTAAELKKEKPAAVAGEHDHDHAGHDHGDHEHGDHGDHEHGDHGHNHVAPHGGNLIMLGDHMAQIEVIIDPKPGILTVYVLDGNAEKPLEIDQSEIAVTVTPEPEADAKEPAPKAIKLMLTRVSNPEAPAEQKLPPMFAGQSDQLKGVDHFDGVFSEIKVAGKDFDDIEFHYHPNHPVEPLPEPAHK